MIIIIFISPLDDDVDVDDDAEILGGGCEDSQCSNELNGSINSLYFHIIGDGKLNLDSVGVYRAP